MAGKASKKQSIGVVFFALIVIIFSVMVTLYFSGAFDAALQLNQGPKYKNITFTDAVLACKAMAKKRFAKKKCVTSLSTITRAVTRPNALLIKFF